MLTQPRATRPFLKWAGGKTQILSELVGFVPRSYGQYIEPFVGAGALFFYLRPERAVLADSNEELINCYEVVRDNIDRLIVELQQFTNEERFYYEVREWDVNSLSPVMRAARTIYLNKTGYNGLYRVNKAGKFNVPFGRRHNPAISDEEKLRGAHEALEGVKLIYGDYKDVLNKYARPGDFVYLDPPYYPAGGFAEFKRYTREFFYESDHIELHSIFGKLVAKGCHVLLTNSNTEFVRRLYADFEYKAIDTRRNISSKAATRTGQDLVILGTAATKRGGAGATLLHGTLLEHFPGTRYMGSKYRVLPFIWECVHDLPFDSVLDAFAGSAAVSYMFKQYRKRVLANDFLHFSYYFGKALIENNCITLDETDIESLSRPNRRASSFIQDTFRGLYFSDDENRFLDSTRANIELLSDPMKKAVSLAALTRACLKRRPRGVFTFVGDRYDDGRRDMRLTLQEHFAENIAAFNAAVFDNGQANLAFNQDVFALDVKADLVYLDPPYFTPNSDNDYVRRYHFVEGLVRQWHGLEIQQHTSTKKFRRYDTPFLSKETVGDAFDRLFARFKNSIIVVSYSSNSIPDKSDLVAMLKQYKKNVHVFQLPLTYSFGNQGHKVGDNANRALEFLFVAY